MCMAVILLSILSILCIRIEPMYWYSISSVRSVRSVYSALCRARDAMEAAEAQIVADPMDQKALDRLMQAQATFEAVGGMTQDRLVAQVRWREGSVTVGFAEALRQLLV